MANLLEKANILITPTAYSDGKIHSAKPIQSLSAEKVVNGDFDTDTNWSKDSGWTISGGSANYDAVSSNQDLEQAITLTEGSVYAITFEIKSGEFRGRFLSLNSSIIENNNYTVGTHTVYGSVSAGSNLFVIKAVNTTGGSSFSIDNVSVKEVIDSDLNFTRGSAGTRVNAQGLIENSQGNNIPRINYKDGVGSWLIEPQSTNLITYSESFGNSYWTKIGAIIQGDPSTAGAEQVVNGSFATDTDWTKEAGWSISSGKLIANTSSTTACYQVGGSTPIITGKTYQVKFEITSYTVGSVNLRAGTEAVITNFNTVGVHTVTMVAGGALQIRFESVGTTVLTIDNCSVKEVQGFYAPSVDSPLGAFKLVFDGSGRNFYTSFASTSGTSSSVYVKGTYGETIRFGVVGGDSLFTLSGEWQRLESYLATSSTIFTLNTYGGATARELYIFGAQLEQSSYASSYIPTNGSVQTRLAETASRSGLGDLIDSIEGVFYAEFSREKGNEDSLAISINDGGTTNSVSMYYFGADSLYVDIFNSSGTVTLSALSIDTSISNKIAVKYKSGDSSLWLNGVEVSTNSEAISLVGLNELSFDYGNTTIPFYGNIKAVSVLPILTDQELECLTTR